ncbi:endolytic transglycosylase MltG [Paenactinomyces guangxiensis]|uniref:endolytic transglycosylase MltG n=1 Tax=Paenactinomyces guangxiensis TaxID=1490290 RepID=UPI0015EF0D77|nr:endolytic transglycosylase MltG [Paenactinomyces guangxiensis]MBH8590904.1 endolytic transglycosylase MltG [Paenactinomyces guangxiensis]
MSRKERYRQQHYHPLVWSLLFGTAFTRTAAFMSLPFLAIYLSDHTELNTVEIGLVLGMSGLGGALGGFVGGYLSDLFGRRVIITLSMIVWTSAFFCFIFAQTYLHFILLNLVHGLCRSFFDPTSQALMSDLTAESKRLKIFGYRYTALNIGLVLGPLLGTVLYPLLGIKTFFFTGVAFFIYSLVLVGQFSRYSHQIKAAEPEAKVSVLECVNVLRKDTSLTYCVLGGALFFAIFAQLEASLPLHLSDDLENGATLYPFLLALNALMVILLQGIVSSWAEHKNVLSSLIIGCLLFALGYMAFSLGGNSSSYILGIIVLTIGEMIIFPVSNQFIDNLADERLRGTYYGAYNFSQIGLFLGPVFGGWLLKGMGGTVMWWIMAALSLHMIWFFAIGYRRYAKKNGIGILQIVQQIFTDLHLTRLVKFSIKMIPLISLITGVSLYFYYYLDEGLASPGRKGIVEIQISENASLRQIGSELKKKQIIKDDSLFPIYYWVNRVFYSNSIQPGVYQVSPHMKIDDVMVILSRGTFTVEIPAGATVTEIADILSSHGVHKEDFLAAVNNETYSFAFLNHIPQARKEYRLEGYLLPGKYEFRKGIRPKEIVNTMLKRFQKVLNKSIYLQRLQKENVTLDEWVTVASLIEQSKQASKAVSAYDIYTMLNKRSALNIPLKDPYNKLKAYNSPERVGLPPGPVNNPGEDSLRAALPPLDWSVVKERDKNRKTTVTEKKSDSKDF